MDPPGLTGNDLTGPTTDPTAENQTLRLQEPDVPQTTLTLPPSDAQTLPSLTPQGLQEVNAHLQQLMRIMGGGFQVPPLVYRTLRSRVVLAPYGVQVEDPPQEPGLIRGKR